MSTNEGGRSSIPLVAAVCLVTCAIGGMQSESFAR